jgi:hypothetical protein
MVGHLTPAGGDWPLTVDAAALTALRARLASPNVQLIADDVTMGGLRTALARLGVSAPDGRDEGLVDPADLTLAWLATLAAAGCDRLLVRGIPWRALPLPGVEVGPPLPGSAAAVLWAPTVAAYTEVRRRAAAGIAFGDQGDDLLWLDATADDRWGAATAIGNWLDARFASITSFGIDDRPEPGRLWSRLLVTSHRPLPPGALRAVATALAPAGVALGAGHPSLGEELAAVLGARWRVQTLADLAPEDFQAIDRKPDPPV